MMNTHTFTINLKLGGIAFGVRGHPDFHVVSLTVGQIEPRPKQLSLAL